MSLHWGDNVDAVKRLLQYFRVTFDTQYHPYKIPAFFIGLLGLCLFLGNVIYNTVVGGILYIGNPSNLISIIFYLLLFYFLVYYNYIDNTRAFSGILIFVFNAILNGILNVIYGYSAGLLSIFTSGFDPWIFAYIAYIAIMIAVVVLGILLYRYSRLYVMGFYRNWKKVRNIGLAFTIVMVLLEVPSILVSLLASGFAFSIYLVLSPLMNICIALCCFFTLIRLKGF